MEGSQRRQSWLPRSIFRQHGRTHELGDGWSGGHECKVTSCCTPTAAGPGPNSGMAYLGVQVGAGNGKHLAEVGGWACSRKQALLGSMLWQ